MHFVSSFKNMMVNHRTVLQLNNYKDPESSNLLQGLNNFCLMFFASAGIGVLFALTSALLLKHIDLRKNPSLEFGMMLIFTYGPYTLAEGVHLSGNQSHTVRMWEEVEVLMERVLIRRNYGNLILWNRDVTLHSFQFIAGNTDNHATNHENACIYCW